MQSQHPSCRKSVLPYAQAQLRPGLLGNLGDLDGLDTLRMPKLPEEACISNLRRALPSESASRTEPGMSSERKP